MYLSIYNIQKNWLDIKGKLKQKKIKNIKEKVNTGKKAEILDILKNEQIHHKEINLKFNDIYHLLKVM